MELKFKHNSFKERLRSMLKVDFRRMFTQPLLYIMVGICLVIPILILVMTNMNSGGGSMDHSVGMSIHHNIGTDTTDMMGGMSINHNTGSEMSMQAFENTWEIIGSVSGDSAEGGGEAAMSMDMTSMCNINLLYFAVAVLVCIFVADDFRSGYAKNLFTVRAKKADYIVSKTLVCFVGGALMLLAFFVGSMLGGAISGLSFELGVAGVGGIVMCMIAKLVLMAVFVPIYLLWSVFAKRKLWMSLLGSLMCGMFLFMMIPMLTPLDATVMHVALCLAGGTLFSAGLGAISSTVLRKTSLV